MGIALREEIPRRYSAHRCPDCLLSCVAKGHTMCKMHAIVIFSTATGRYTFYSVRGAFRLQYNYLETSWRAC